MRQVEFAVALGVSTLTVSQWETGYRMASSLALRAIEMLKEIGGMQKEFIEKAEKVFDRLNAGCFQEEI